jgi:hypothetical protein
LQENLIKQDKAASSNGAVLASQSSPPEDDDDEAQADGPSQDGAPGDISTLHILFAEFLIKLKLIL